ncbi:MAG: hypothetical protein ACTSSG_11245, partial [Candidatus Heimdallarchaeaceae archaeon]
NTTSFFEIQLTESADFMEMYAQLEISQNYFHFLWSSRSMIDTPNQTNLIYSIFYNRIALTDENKLFKNGFSKYQLNNLEIDSSLKGKNIFFLLSIFVASQNEHLKNRIKINLHENS